MLPSLWHHPDFRRLWAGQTASQLGEHTSLVIIPLVAVLSLHAAPDQLGLLRAAGQAPMLLLTLLAGVWVDRLRTRTVMVAADAGRALALGAIAVVVPLTGIGLPALAVVAFAVGSLSVLFDVAYQTSLPRLVRRDQLLRGTSAVEGSRSAAQIAGPALGGSLVSLLSAPVACAAGALLFVASSGSIARIRHRETVAPPEGRSWRHLRLVAREPLLRTMALASAAFQFSFAALMTAYLVFLPRDLGLSGAEIGLVLAAVGPGALAGSLLAARLPGRYGHGPVLVVAAALGDGVLLGIPFAGSAVAPLVLINFVFGALGQLVNVTMTTVRQAISPPEFQGRIAATIMFAGMGATPAGSLAGGFLAAHVGLRPALLIAAIGMQLSPALMALSPLGRLGRELAEDGAQPRSASEPT
ncbi:MFS transporter [Actinoplanes sp. RD1]|uniref:MFS transporter n=1 Tax=Actinoplanes sp. RD1 TaxID=3064538 RepID=UPI002740E355|nr:MFS transporter [Actinoplanes sp. RD1]